MKAICQKLDKNRIDDLLALSKADGFPCELTEALASLYCGDRAPKAAGAQTYGAFAGDRLVSVMTATFCLVFPCDDSPSGRIVQISGAYTHPAYCHKGCALDLLTLIEEDAKVFGADYLCCDSIANGLYLHFGFKPTDDCETRMWKTL